jgi:hypothetical protein
MNLLPETGDTRRTGGGAKERSVEAPATVAFLRRSDA